MERCLPRRQLLRGWRKLDDCLANDVVQAKIAQRCAILIDLIAQARPSLFPFDAAHFENVGKIGVEANRKRNLDGQQAIVDQLQPLITDRLPDEFRTIKMQITAAQRDGAVDVNIGVGRIDGEENIVFFDHRAQ